MKSREIDKKIFFFILVSLLIGGFLMFQETVNARIGVKNRVYQNSLRTLLLGASVGKGWNFPQLPERIRKSGYTFEMIDVYSFDKSAAIDEILMRPKRKPRFNKTFFKGFFIKAPEKPDVIIIKECAAYFPGDMEKYQNLVKKWISQIEAAGIKPILATVVPVTENHSQTRPGRLQGVLQYNDWIREYAKEDGLRCLDFEAALRISEKNKALREDLTSGDGLHLNKKAYGILDTLMIEFLKKQLI